ncbi:MAG: glycosyltransferase [Paludibacteraceae bacterium]
MEYSENDIIYNTLISVVIPVFNSSGFICECIDSVLNQTFQDFEIIIVDDGSTDNSVDIIKSYKDTRIKLICNTHNFIESLNIGMSKAQGKYIARMDSDDIMLPERLLLQYDYLEAHPDVDVCGGFAQCFGESDRQISLATSHKDIISGFILHNMMAHPTVMLRKRIVFLFPKEDNIYQCYNPEYQYAEDYKLWTELAMKGCRFANITTVILKYRISVNQVTSQKQSEMMASSYKISAEFVEFVGELIVKQDKAYENILNEAIELHNNDKIQYYTLQNILSNLPSFINN